VALLHVRRDGVGPACGLIIIKRGLVLLQVFIEHLVHF
jgi:hypothetical protein